MIKYQMYARFYAREHVIKADQDEGTGSVLFLYVIRGSTGVLILVPQDEILTIFVFA